MTTTHFDLAQAFLEGNPFATARRVLDQAVALAAPTPSRGPRPHPPANLRPPEAAAACPQPPRRFPYSFPVHLA